MRRIYLYNHLRIGNKIFISDEPAHYLKNVLRMVSGSRFYAFDGTGIEYTLEIKKISSSGIETEIINEKHKQHREPGISIELCLCLCKNRTFESVIKKAAEIGVTKIIPVKSARSIIEIDNKKLPLKIGRWSKIAAEGSKIAGRTRVPEIKQPQDFETVVAQNMPGILFWEQSQVSIKDIFSSFLASVEKKRFIRVFIGPEGGFTDNEVEKAIKNQIFIASLGPRILSVETASILALGIVFYESGLFNIPSEKL
ncbi:MAG: RsmE family RNA methyltransferase [Candidatus Ratteibacteria bacterium]